MTTWSV